MRFSLYRSWPRIAALIGVAVLLAGCTTPATTPPSGAAQPTAVATKPAPTGETSTPGVTPAAGVKPAPTPTRSLTPGPAPTPAVAGIFGFGQPITDQSVLQVWSAPPSGEGLPAGSGTPQEGAQIYAQRCASCHGANGEGTPIGPQLVSEPGRYQVNEPRTIGNYWPYATTIFNYVKRSMPFDNPGTLTDEEVYALTAYLLNRNQIIGDNEEMNAQTLPAVQMPNQPSFESCWPDGCTPTNP